MALAGNPRSGAISACRFGLFIVGSLMMRCPIVVLCSLVCWMSGWRSFRRSCGCSISCRSSRCSISDCSSWACRICRRVPLGRDRPCCSPSFRRGAAPAPRFLFLEVLELVDQVAAPYRWRPSFPTRVGSTSCRRRFGVILKPPHWAHARCLSWRTGVGVYCQRGRGGLQGNRHTVPCSCDLLRSLRRRLGAHVWRAPRALHVSRLDRGVRSLLSRSWLGRSCPAEHLPPLPFQLVLAACPVRLGPILVPPVLPLLSSMDISRFERGCLGSFISSAILCFGFPCRYRIGPFPLAFWAGSFLSAGSCGFDFLLPQAVACGGWWSGFPCSQLHHSQVFNLSFYPSREALMTCFYLRKAFRTLARDPETGKRGITFNPVKGLIEGSGFMLPCNQCSGCRIARARSWSIRAMHEAQMHEHNCFVTLTYDDQHVPQDYSVKLADYQAFFKRWQMRAGPGRRYMGVAEYSDAPKLRPHIHALLFNWDFPDKKRWMTRNGHRVFTSEMLSELWPFGLHEIGSVTGASAGYVARYCMKKFTGIGADDHYTRVSPVDGQTYRVSPEFMTMSRRPGLGSTWFDAFRGDAFPSDFLIVDGSKVPVPAYYLGKLLKDAAGDAPAGRVLRHAASAEQTPIKRKRKRASVQPAQRANSTPARLAVREEILASRLKRLVRSL